MREPKTKILISLPVMLLKQIDRKAKDAMKDRSTFISETLERKFFGDDMRKANQP